MQQTTPSEEPDYGVYDPAPSGDDLNEVETVSSFDPERDEFTQSTKLYMKHSSGRETSMGKRDWHQEQHRMKPKSESMEYGYDQSGSEPYYQDQDYHHYDNRQHQAQSPMPKEDYQFEGYHQAHERTLAEELNEATGYAPPGTANNPDYDYYDTVGKDVVYPEDMKDDQARSPGYYDDRYYQDRYPQQRYEDRYQEDRYPKSDRRFDDYDYQEPYEEETQGYEEERRERRGKMPSEPSQEISESSEYYSKTRSNEDKVKSEAKSKRKSGEGKPRDPERKKDCSKRSKSSRNPEASKDRRQKKHKSQEEGEERRHHHDKRKKPEDTEERSSHRNRRSHDEQPSNPSRRHRRREESGHGGSRHHRDETEEVGSDYETEFGYDNGNMKFIEDRSNCGGRRK